MSSDFSRSFRAQFGVLPSAFDLDTYLDARRGQLVDVTGHRLERLPAGENPDGSSSRCATCLRAASRTCA